MLILISQTPECGHRFLTKVIFFILGGSKNRNFTAKNKIYMARGGGLF